MPLTTLKKFLDDKAIRRNEYVTFPGFKHLYVRNTRRFFDGAMRSPVLDIANAEAKVPGQGAGTKLIKHLRTKHPELWLYVECVLNDRLPRKLTELGFVRCDVGLSICFYLPPKEGAWTETKK